VTPLLWRALLRHLLRHPWQLGLAILGIALGVAIVLAVDLANASARRSFDLAMNRITGHATHRIVGGGQGVPETLYVQLRVERGLRHISPVVTGYLPRADSSGQLLQILGVDPFAEAPFRDPAADLSGSDFDLRALLLNPDAALLPRALGDQVTLRRGQQQFTLNRAGTLNGPELDGLIIADLSTAQTLLGKAGRLSHIDLIATQDAAGERLIAELRAELPPGLRLERAAERNQATMDLSAAFSLNLTAMSLLALVVGMFLIYNAISFSVVQRRALLGMLRALGVSRRELFIGIWARRCYWDWREPCLAGCWVYGWDRDWCIWSPAPSTICTTSSAFASFLSNPRRWQKARRWDCWRRWRQPGCQRGKRRTRRPVWP
jgi:putative ABC transport system permease protein